MSGLRGPTVIGTSAPAQMFGQYRQLRSTDNVVTKPLFPWAPVGDIDLYYNYIYGDPAFVQIINAGYWVPWWTYGAKDQTPWNNEFYFLKDTDWLSPVACPFPFSFDGVGIYNGLADVGKSVRVGMYAADVYGQPTGAPLFDATLSLTSAVTFVTASFTQVNCNAGSYVVAVNSNQTNATSAYGYGFSAGVFMWDFGGPSIQPIGQIGVSRSFGAFPNPHPGWAAADVQVPAALAPLLTMPFLHLV